MTARASRLVAALSLALAVSALAPPAAGVKEEGDITEFPIWSFVASPVEIAAGPDGNLWFTLFHPGRIGRITPDGRVTEFAIPTPFSQPEGITAGPDGALWFAEINGNKIGRFDPTKPIANAFTEFPLPQPDSRPFDIAAGPDGNLWFTEKVQPGRIGMITPAGAITEFSLLTATGPTPGNAGQGIGTLEERTVMVPHKITLGPDGNLWFTTRPGGLGFVSTIGRIDPDDGAITLFRVPADPWDITAGPEGNLWFSIDDPSIQGVGRISPDGQQVATFLPNINTEGGITVGPDGSLWFVEREFKKIGRVSAAGTGHKDYKIPVDSVVGETSPNGSGIALGADAHLWFTDSRSDFEAPDKIGRISAVPAPAAQMSGSPGPPCALVDVSGSSFGAFELVRLSLGGPALGPGWRRVGTALTNSTGGFVKEDVQVPPDAASGDVTLRVAGSVSRAVALEQNAFTVGGSPTCP